MDNYRCLVGFVDNVSMIRLYWFMDNYRCLVGFVDDVSVLVYGYYRCLVGFIESLYWSMICLLAVGLF